MTKITLNFLFSFQKHQSKRHYRNMKWNIRQKNYIDKNHIGKWKFTRFFLSRSGYILEEFFFANFSSLRGENSRKLSVLHTEKWRHVSSFQYRDSRATAGWSLELKLSWVFTHYHVEITWSFDGDCVFTTTSVPIDTCAFITSIVQIFREIELMYYNFFS